VAEAPAPSKSLLTSKWGPFPVWVYGLAGLIAAWLVAKWRASQSEKKGASQADTADLADTAETEQVAPQFIIENNMPAGVGAPTTPSAPITTPPVPPPTTTLPGKLPNPPGTTPPKPPAKKPPAKKKEPLEYKVKHNDTLSAIAKKHHTTTAALWTFNITPGNRPANTIKTLKARGPNLLYAGETILIPQ
jgi:LysM repeat protein